MLLLRRRDYTTLFRFLRVKLGMGGMTDTGDMTVTDIHPRVIRMLRPMAGRQHPAGQVGGTFLPFAYLRRSCWQLAGIGRRITGSMLIICGVEGINDYVSRLPRMVLISTVHIYCLLTSVRR